MQEREVHLHEREKRVERRFFLRAHGKLSSTCTTEKARGEDGMQERGGIEASV